MTIQKYTKVLHIGDPLLKELFNTKELIIEEKLDGSQFRIHAKNGELTFGSHRVNFTEGRLPDKMFNLAIEQGQAFKTLKGEWMIYAEYLQKPRHNTLIYDRVPKNNLMIFDVLDIKEGQWLDWDTKKLFAEKFGFEAAPILFHGNGKEVTPKVMDELITQKSFLGKEIIEGIVIKNYDKMHSVEYLLGKPLIGKYVRERFKERNRIKWKDKDNIVLMIQKKYHTEARWDKAIQRFIEEGKLTYSPKDIGFLMKDIVEDVEEEEKEQIKEDLYKWALKKIRKGWVRGFPQYYKDWLLKNQLSKDGEVNG